MGYIFLFFVDILDLVQEFPFSHSDVIAGPDPLPVLLVMHAHSHDVFQEFLLALFTGELQSPSLCLVFVVGEVLFLDGFEAVSLLDEELLSFESVVDFIGAKGY